jgi:hemerythrin
MEIDPKYSIGIPEMDAQHARWIGLIEKFRTASASGLQDRVGIDAAAVALKELQAYTLTHFGSEERFLADLRYPDLEAHKHLHRELEREVARLLAEIQSPAKDRAPLKLNLFINIWMLDHILKEDAKYARFVLQRS